MGDMDLAIHAECKEADTQSTAVRLMLRALELIDSDPTISSVVGAHLQMAIDSLWRNVSADPASVELH